MFLIILILIGAIGGVISILWLGVALFATWYYRPKKLTKKYQFKA